MLVKNENTNSSQNYRIKISQGRAQVPQCKFLKFLTQCESYRKGARIIQEIPEQFHLEDLLLLLLLSLFSRVRLCATPETAAHQAPLSLGFSRQERWSGFAITFSNA